jgi:hypothetical protein
VAKVVRAGIRGKLSSHSTLISLLKGVQSPVLSLRRLLRPLLLIYDAKHARNHLYALSLYPNHVRQPLSSSLLYPNYGWKPLCFYLLDLLHPPFLLPSLRASCWRINGV